MVNQPSLPSSQWLDVGQCTSAYKNGDALRGVLRQQINSKYQLASSVLTLDALPFDRSEASVLHMSSLYYVTNPLQSCLSTSKYKAHSISERELLPDFGGIREDRELGGADIPSGHTATGLTGTAEN